MCEILTGHTKQNCASNGGVKSVVVYNMEKRATYTLVANDLTGLTLEVGAQGYRIKPDMASIQFTETATRSRENNSLFYAISGSIIIKDDEQATRDLIALLAGGFFGMIVEKEDGKNIHLGLVNGMTLESGEIATGLNYEDLNGATLNFIGKEVSIAPSVSDAIVATTLTVVPGP